MPRRKKGNEWNKIVSTRSLTRIREYVCNGAPVYRLIFARNGKRMEGGNRIYDCKRFPCCTPFHAVPSLFDFDCSKRRKCWSICIGIYLLNCKFMSLLFQNSTIQHNWSDSVGKIAPNFCLIPLSFNHIYFLFIMPSHSAGHS